MLLDHSRGLMWTGLVVETVVGMIDPSFILFYSIYIICGAIYYDNLCDLKYKPSMLDLTCWVYSMYMILIKNKRAFL